jgi:hypothetical protein
MAYTLVPTELIVDGAVTSAKLDTNIAISGTLGVTGELTLATHMIMGDNDKIKIGTGGDLEIYHDGSNSYISNSTGNIYLADTNGSVHIQAKLNEESIVCTADGAVSLYHDNAVKLATSSAGVSVTGTVVADGLTVDTSTLVVDATNNRVGIGLTNPANSLEIQHGTIGTGNGSNNTLALRYNSTTLYGQHYMDANGLYHIRADGQGVAGGNLILGGDTSVQIWTGSTPESRVTVDSSGAFGIGVVPQTNRFAGHDVLQIGARGTLLANDTGSSTGQTALLDNLFYNSAGNFRVRDGSNATAGVAMQFVEGNVIFSNSAATTGDPTVTERMRIDSNGTITQTTSSASPVSANFVTGNSNCDITMQSANTSSLTRLRNGTNDFQVHTNGTERMRIDSVGEVSIKRAGSGGSGVLKALNLNHAGTSVNDGAKISFTAGTSSEGAGIASTGQAFNSADLRFYAGGTTERWRIDSSGRMTNGFDGSSYGSFLQVAGNSISGGVVNFIDPDVSVATSNHILRCTFSVDTDSQGKFIAFYDGGGNIGSVSQNGASSVLFNTTSDERLKENIVDASSQLDVIKNVKVREFDWKSSSKHDIGMIAQELKDVIPNVVIEGGDDVTEEPFGVDYGKLTPYLIKAIQEQQVIIEDLKSRIETLENE